MRGASNVRLLGFLGAGCVLSALWALFGGGDDDGRLPAPLDPTALREKIGPLTEHERARGAALQSAFVHGGNASTDQEQVRVEVKQVGTLKVRSRRIVACDPYLLFPEPRPFARDVRNGDFPVEVSIIHRPNGDRRIAMARVRFSDRLPVAFQLAPFEGTELSELIDAGEVTGHAVEEGAASFFDAEAALELWRRKQSGAAHDQAFPKRNRLLATPSSAEVAVDDVGGANGVLFSAGFGDGFCLCFWAYDAWGELVALVTDCNVLAGEKEDG